MTIRMRTFIAAVTALALGAAVTPAAAQAPTRTLPQQPERPAVSEPTTVEVDAQAEAELKRQTGIFEGVLLQAVQQGGQRLAHWAQQVEPRVVLAQASNPVVQAVPLPDSSLVFNVQVPEILQTSVMLFHQLQRPGARPVSRTTGRVGGTGVVPDDPTAERVADAESLDPDRRYSDYVRAALIEALLDGAAVLQIEETQWLTVAASGVDVAVTNPLYRNPSRKLVLSLKGADLLALRQQRITRDEARARILERRF
ncbi:MAG TPA: hypothetical protein VLA20_12075 [Vicinamibacterales bacterium]|nr:hypothetical protein [Vicinamibacterales bacterium]